LVRVWEVWGHRDVVESEDIVKFEQPVALGNFHRSQEALKYILAPWWRLLPTCVVDFLLRVIPIDPRSRVQCDGWWNSMVKVNVQ
jgi:hypothetical protein